MGKAPLLWEGHELQHDRRWHDLTLILFQERTVDFEIGILGQIARTVSGSIG